MMTIEDKQKIFVSEYEMFGWSLQDTYKFLSLVGYLYNAAVKKDPSITVYSLLNKMYTDDQRFQTLFERTQFHIAGHLYRKDNFSALGLKSMKDVIAAIKGLLNDWLPF